MTGSGWDNSGIIGKKQGHTVRSTGSGAEALEAARVFRPEAYLLDIGLPDIDGHAVASQLRQEGLSAGAKPNALSGYGQQLDRQRSREAGFHEYLVKPVEFHKLHELLRSID